MELVIRFFVGGLVVSFFAVIGDGFKPKSFAGLFGAAPSVALATLTLTILLNGASYAATEAHSMIVGAFAFLAYAWLCMQAMARTKVGAMTASISMLAIWLAVAIGTWALILR